MNESIHSDAMRIKQATTLGQRIWSALNHRGSTEERTLRITSNHIVST